MKDKFGPNARITLRIGTFRSNQAEMEATNLDRYGGEPFDPRYMEVDRIIASNFVEVEEEPEEKAAREKANEEAYNTWAKQQNERATQVQALAATDQAAAMQLQMRYMMQPLPQPKPTSPPKPRRVEMFLVKWTGLSYSQCTWETAEDIDDEPKIAQYRRFNKQPSRGERQLPPDYSQVRTRALTERCAQASALVRRAELTLFVVLCRMCRRSLMRAVANGISSRPSTRASTRCANIRWTASTS
jgi:hypothetical protein